jgi:hypothetical protein
MRKLSGLNNDEFMRASLNRQKIESRLRRIRVVKLGKTLGVIVGVAATVVSIVIPLHQLASEQARTNDAAEKTRKFVQASSLSAIIQLLDREVAIKSRIQNFLNNYSDAEKVKSMVRKFATGEKAYYSTEFDDMRAVGHHYEALGALVRKGYIDEDLIYATVDLPRDFWDRTSGFREIVQKENWNGPGSALPDFWENFQWLYTQYETKHESLKKEGQWIPTR